MDTGNARIKGSNEPETDKSLGSVDNPGRNSRDLSFPGSSDNPVNGNYSPDEDEDEVEEDLILGDEDAAGDEEEFDVELDEDIAAVEIDEDDLVIDPDDEDEDDDDL